MGNVIEKLNRDNLIFIECVIAATHQNTLSWTANEVGKTCRMEATSQSNETTYSFVVTLHPDKQHYIYNLAQKDRDGKINAFPSHSSKTIWNEYDIELDRPRIIKAYERLYEIIVDKTKREGNYYYSK